MIVESSRVENSANKLCLAFSCLGSTLSSLLKTIKNEGIADSEDVEILILIQRWDIVEEARNLPKFIKLVYLNSEGLSRSRNAAIEHAKSEWIWFLDDDVIISQDNLKFVRSILEQGKSDFYRMQIGCIEWQDQTFKKYKPLKSVSKLNLLQVSSIEIIANLNFIKKHKLTFNDNIGLGTKFPATEEVNFLVDAWEVGAKFQFIDEVVIRHTCIFDDRVLANDEIFRVRGATASRFGVLGYALIVRWAIRYAIKLKKVSYLLSMFKGFVGGYKQFKSGQSS